MIFCAKEEYCIVINFEKRQRELHRCLYNSLSLSLLKIYLYSILFFTDLGGFPGNQETPLGAPLYGGYYFLLRLDERRRTCRLYNRVPTSLHTGYRAYELRHTITCRLCYAT